MELSIQKFGFDLLKSRSTIETNGNVIYSPMSIYVALGMTLLGAHGPTLDEMSKTLHWKVDDTKSNLSQISKLMIDFNQDNAEMGLVKIANKLFVDNKFQLLDSFKEVINGVYDGSFDMVDFKTNFDKARLLINEWVEKQTNSKIKDLLTPGSVHALTRLILVNALYFKGSWQDAFRNCGKHDFHLLDQSTKSVDMIEKSKFYPYFENKCLGFRAVQIPFKMIGNNNYLMLIVLPNDKYSLINLEKEFFEKGWDSVLSNDFFESKSVNVIMPKFRIESSFKLKNILKNLGMVISFSDDADFSLMTGHRDLMIDDVIHKAFIDVDEHGVEAAAATAVMMMLRCAPMPICNPIEFKCDHPFMFALIKEGTLPVFIGHLLHI